jgi:hypothetical protein
MDDLKKDEHAVGNIDAETPKEQQQRSSRFQSKPVLPEGYKKIRSSAWITLARRCYYRLFVISLRI